MELTSSMARKKLLNPTFASLWLIMFLVEFVKGALIVSILPVYMGDVLKLSAFAIGLSFSMQYIGDNLFRSPAGWLIERIGFRRTMSLGLTITLGAVAMIAFLPSMGFLVLGCALLGIGTAPLWPCVLMGITAVTEENNNFATAMGEPSSFPQTAFPKDALRCRIVQAAARFNGAKSKRLKGEIQHTRCRLGCIALVPIRRGDQITEPCRLSLNVPILQRA